MIRDFSDFVRSVERRARLIAGGRAAGIVLLTLGSLHLSFSILAHLAGRPIPIALILLGMLVPLLASAVASLVFYRRRIDPAGLLLRLDLSLGLEARLSSLYELRRTGSDAIRRRIEAALPSHIDRWKSGLPIPRRAIASLAVGIGFFIAGGILSLYPAGSAFRAEGLPLAAASADVEGTPITATEGGDDRTPPLAEGAEALAPPDREGGYTFSDLLSELRIPPLLLSGTSAPAEGELSRLLARIEERLSTEGGLLTEAERAELSGAIPAAPLALAEGIGELLAASSPAEVAAAAAQLSRSAASVGGSDGAATGSEAGAAGGSSGRTVGIPESEGESGIPSASPDGEGLPPGSGRPAEEPTEVGAPPPPGEGDFLTAPVPGIVGEEGKIELFLTAGVPIEYGDGEGSIGKASVSFERIDSILSERSLPPGAVEAVKDYFETITEGGE